MSSSFVYVVRKNALFSHFINGIGDWKWWYEESSSSSDDTQLIPTWQTHFPLSSGFWWKNLTFDWGHVFLINSPVAQLRLLSVAAETVFRSFYRRNTLKSQSSCLQVKIGKLVRKYKLPLYPHCPLVLKLQKATRNARKSYHNHSNVSLIIIYANSSIIMLSHVLLNLHSNCFV